MTGKKLKEFAPQESFKSLTDPEKLAALHRGFMILFLRSRRKQAEIASLNKRVQDLDRRPKATKARE